MSLSQEEISNFKEVFSLFDKDDDGLVQLSDLPLMIRSQNLYPTKEELNVMIAELKQEGNENIDFPEYVSLLTKQKKKQTQDPQEELMDALKVIDKEKKQGFISTKQIRFWMISNGENLTEEETTQLIKEGDPNNTGNIRFNDLVRRLTQAYTY